MKLKRFKAALALLVIISMAISFPGFGSITFASDTIDEDVESINCPPEIMGTGDTIIRGIVTDASTGEPIEDVKIFMNKDDLPYYYGTNSDSQGEYSCIVPAGYYNVSAEGDEVGYANDFREDIIVAEGQTTTVNFELQKVPSGVIRGLVTDGTAGTPVQNAIIHIYNDDYYLFAETNQQGEYSRTVPAGIYTVYVRGDEVGYANLERDNITIVDGETTTVDFEPEKLPTGTFSGRVTDAETNTPIYNIEISIYNNDHHMFTRTNDLGEYSLTVPAGIYTVSVRGVELGYENRYQEDVTINDGATTTIEFELKTVTFGTIGGTVTNADGDPIKNVEISIHNDDYSYYFYTETNQQGEYSCAVPAGIYTVSAQGVEVGYSNSTKESVVVVDGETTTADFQLEKVGLGTISGTVTNTYGDPIKNVEISIHNDDYSYYFYTETNQQGKYSHTVPAGIYTVRAEGVEVGYSNLQQNNVVVAENETTTIDFQLEIVALGTISGTVTDAASGGSIEGVQIVISNNYYWFLAETDNLGEYSITVPVGNYTVLAAGYEFGYFSPEEPNVNVAENVNTIINFELEPIIYGFISGTVTNGENPIEGVKIFLYNDDLSFDAATRTNEQGQYTVTVPIGNYTVEAQGDEAGYSYLWESNVVVEEDKTTIVDFQLEQITWGTVSGTVTDAETSEPIAGLWIDVYFNIFNMYSAMTDELGQYSIDVPVGSGYTVGAYAMFDGYANTHFNDVTVLENEPVTCDFQLTRLKYATISGKVIDETTKTGIPGVEIKAERVCELGYVYSYSTITDKSGEYTLTVTEGAVISGQLTIFKDSASTDDDYIMVAYGPGYLYGIEQDVEVQENITTAIDFYLEGGLTNDDFAHSYRLSGIIGSAIGANTGATKEPGEPNHDSDPGGKSAWWLWTAPISGSVTFDTAGSRFDPALGVYTGDNVADLTAIASNGYDDDQWTGRATFFAEAGTTYYIAVDGYRYFEDYVDNGFIKLTWGYLHEQEVTAVAAAVKAVAEPFSSTAGVAGLRAALDLYYAANTLVKALPDSEDKSALQNHLAEVWAAIETRLNVLSGEAETALTNAETLVASPFPESGTADQVNSVLRLVNPHAAFIDEFMDDSARIRLTAIQGAAQTRYDSLLAAASQTVKTVWNDADDRYEAGLKFANDTVSIQIISADPVADVELALIRSSVSPVDVAPTNRTAANIYLDIRVLEGSLESSVALIEIGYDISSLPQGVSEENLKLYRFNEATGAWEPLPNQGVDTDRQVIWAYVSGGFSMFGVYEFDFSFGDVNLDRNINVGDAIMVLRHIVGLAKLDSEQLWTADVDGSGNVNVGDAILILRRIVGLLDKFPVELN
jgi:hypothetical protein